MVLPNLGQGPGNGLRILRRLFQFCTMRLKQPEDFPGGLSADVEAAAIFQDIRKEKPILCNGKALRVNPQGF